MGITLIIITIGYFLSTAQKYNMPEYTGKKWSIANWPEPN